MEHNWMRITARALSLVWASWWVFFEGAEAVGSGKFGQAVIFVVFMFGAAALAWKWEVAGGLLLILEAMAALAMFTPMWLRRFDLFQASVLFVMMPAPPLLSGILFLWHGMNTRKREQAAAEPGR